MAITDYNPMNANLRAAVGRFLSATVKAFTPQPRYTEDQAQKMALGAVNDALSRLSGVMGTPDAPEVKGAGWTASIPPILRTNEEQQLVWQSTEAKYGRATTGAGPTPLAMAERIADLSIERIAQYYWQAVQQGYCTPKADLDAGVMREDGHLQGAHRSIVAATYRAPLQLRPRDPSPLARAVCSFTRTVLDGCSNFMKAEEDLMMSGATGHAGTEIVWTTPRPITFTVGRSRLTAPGAKGVHSLEWVPQRDFRIEPVHRRVLLDMGGNKYIDPFKNPDGTPTRKLIYHGGYGHGDAHQRGYMYAANPLCLFKKMGLARFLVCLDLFGIQTPYMQYELEDYADAKDVSAAQRFLSAIGKGFPAVLSRKFGEVKLTPPPTGVDARGMHMCLLGWVNAELSKLVAGQTLAMEIGGTGSYGAADVHEGSREDVKIICTQLLSATLEQQLLVYIVQENLPALMQALKASAEQILGCVPRCYRVIDRRVDPVQRLGMFATAVKPRDQGGLGMNIDPEQMAEELNFRQVSGQDDEYTPPQGAPVAAPGEGQDAGEGEEDDAEIGDGSDADPPEDAAPTLPAEDA